MPKLSSNYTNLPDAVVSYVYVTSDNDEVQRWILCQPTSCIPTNRKIQDSLNFSCRSRWSKHYFFCLSNANKTSQCFECVKNDSLCHNLLIIAQNNQKVSSSSLNDQFLFENKNIRKLA